MSASAIRYYVRSFSYRHTLAQLGSIHYLDGKPVEPMSKKDRHDMQCACEVDQERARQRKAAAIAISAAAAGAERDGPAEGATSSGSQGA